jgi:Domain of unknown function (DUF5666)
MKFRRSPLMRAVSISSILFACLALSLAPAKSTAAQEEGRPQRSEQNGDRRMPVFGKITAVHADSFEIANPNGETLTVKLTNTTEFRKDRQQVKRTDFKVGDLVIVRGEENSDHTWTAQMVGGRSANSPEGRGQFFTRQGTLGKDYVIGEVKTIDAPKISVLRSDNVTQTIELNEDTSLRKGRESVTMADVQVGDHLFAQGALQNDVFVPKMVVVMGPEQWKRLQEMGGGVVVQSGPSGSAPAKPVKPPEPQN